MKLPLKIFTFAASLALLAVSAVGQATPIKATYTIDLNTSDPGLMLNSMDLADNPFSFSLNPGESQSGDLFRIWTNETNVNDDDEVSKAISANFNFLLPEVFGGSVTGTTVGGNVCFFCGLDYGTVTWDGPADLYFGPHNDGHLRITLSDETFHLSPIGIGGYLLGANVSGTIELIADATTAVPEPNGLVLFGLSLLAISGLASRRRKGNG